MRVFLGVSAVSLFLSACAAPSTPSTPSVALAPATSVAAPAAPALAAPAVQAAVAAPRSLAEIPGLGWNSQTVVYRCQAGTLLQVAYLNVKKKGASFAALHYDGNTVLLQSRPTGSGARYIALDEQNSLRWYTKGGSGQLAFMAADHTASEQTLLSDCQAQS